MSDAIGRPIVDDDTGPLTTTEARLLAERERARQDPARAPKGRRLGRMSAPTFRSVTHGT